MSTQRFCRVCNGWHDLDEPWPEACFEHFARRETGRAEGVQIIKDIEPYKAMGGDVAVGGKAPVIGSRRDHRAYLKRNGYAEIGNEIPKNRENPLNPVTGREIKDAWDQVKARQNR